MNSISDETIQVLHDEQHYALDRISDCKGVVLITGKAGTGKSTLFNLFNRITNKKTIVLAPTGIAAINIGGQTIHSFFRLPPSFITSKDYHPLSKSLVKKIELIVIDEISMVRADMLDHIDQILRLSTHSDIPFGGIPMIWIGDLYQLPPILSNNQENEHFLKHYESPYFFSAKVMNEISDFELIELSQVFRQSDPQFIKLLNRIRVNQIDEEDLEYINQRNIEIPNHNLEPIIQLCSTNYVVNQINQTELSKINKPVYNYKAEINGQINASHFPVDQMLQFKEGAQVMAIRNSPDKEFVNGSLGIIEELLEDEVKVRFENSTRITSLRKVEWEIIRYKAEKGELIKEVIGSFKQIPLRLAWAITIHKSQGKTFDRIILDLGRGAFESGQTYVALSRCRSLEGIYLKQKLSWRDIRTDERVSEFLQKYS